MQVEGVQAWLEAITYQMQHMSHAEQAARLAGPIALLKLFATRVANDVSDEACQIFGGRAITATGMGQVVERFQRSVKFGAILGGSEEIMVISASDRRCAGCRTRGCDSAESHRSYNRRIRRTKLSRAERERVVATEFPTRLKVKKKKKKKKSLARASRDKSVYVRFGLGARRASLGPSRSVVRSDRGRVISGDCVSPGGRGENPPGFLSPRPRLVRVRKRIFRRRGVKRPRVFL